MRLFVLILTGAAMAGGCVAHDGSKPGESPLWYPAFVVRDQNTTRQWGGQNIYGVQTGRVDPTKQPSIGAPGSALPVNPPDSIAVAAAAGDSNWADSSRFYVAGQSRSPVVTNSQQPYSQGQRPPGSATLYPTRGNAAEAVGSPTLYPPVGSFRTDQPSGASVNPNGATGERGIIGK